MKNTTAALLCILLILTSTAALAQNERALGKSHYAFELDFMFMQHRTFDTDDGGAYFGFAGYGHVGNNWYLGGEIGGGFGFGALISDSSTYMPLELNVKKAFALSQMWVVTVGGGLSYNRVEFSHNAWFSDDDFEVTDWVFGGQVLCDFLFRAGQIPLGLKLMYQLTADLPGVADRISPEEGWNYSNFKIGIQVGFMVP